MVLGFIGLGRMGKPMLQNLIQAGYKLVIYTRNQEKMHRLAADLALEHAHSVAELAERCDIVLTMLANNQAVKAVYSQGLPVAFKNQLWLEMSTISPQLSTELSQQAKEQGKGYLDAPVSGSTDAAEAKKLVFMLGCEQEPEATVTQILLSMGRAYHCLGKVGSGHVAKLLINGVIHSQNQIVSEILCLAKSMQLSSDSLLDLLLNSAASSPMFHFRRDLYAGKSEDVPFLLPLAAKDMRLLQSMAEQQQLFLPQITLNSEQLQRAADDGRYVEKDMSAMKDYLRDTNNVKGSV